MTLVEKVIHNLASELSSPTPKHYLTCKASLEGLVNIAIQQYQADIERDFQQANEALHDKK